ncbi:ABC transporter ATP-binding protein [Brevibacillus parabrevis]|uniref:ABC transporter ATP-binding protein n=1 Tax=Brevibacillus parabrevis TaxID=54914 RepID=UPI002E2115E9|nr:ABC transporter ATP-binding protein [Brevibacillus parabrevis]
MNQMPMTPMGVGKLLDKSFNVYRQHFGAFFLLALIWFGPFLLVQQLLLIDVSSIPLLMQDTEGLEFWEAMGEKFGGQEELLTQNVAMMLLYAFVVAPLTMVVAYPQLIAGATFMTKSVLEEQPVDLKAGLKQALGRFWPLVGSTIVYGLLAVALTIGFLLVFMLIGFLLALATGNSIETFFDSDSTLSPFIFIVVFLFGYILFLAGIVLVPGYFLLRWSFYLPLVLFERNGIGIDKSWNLTKGNFWRLFAIYLVLSILYSIFSGGIQVAVMGIMGTSVISQIIMVVLSCLLMPWMAIVYALAYFDLRVRKDGTDLEALMSKQLDQDIDRLLAKDSGATHE